VLICAVAQDGFPLALLGIYFVSMDELHTEVQVDGLAGPTHHFGGLSHGNLASQAHAGFHSHPRAAALQGLEKMRFVMRLGVTQAWLPPLLRPDVAWLRRCGFSGTDAQVVTAAADEPHLLKIATSSAFMWSANCATVIPAGDSRDGHCHIVIANLQAMSHRAGEGEQRAAQWRALCAKVPLITVHDPLPLLPALGDEGAANHSRVVSDENVTHLFVFGRQANAPITTRLPARQTREASAAVARCAGLSPSSMMTVQQSPAAIDAGAFHNDVVMVGCNAHVLIHVQAWVDQAQVLAQLRQRHPSLSVAEISNDDLTLDEAVASYLFNSQLLQTPAGVVLIAPAQAQHGRAGAVIKRLCANGFLHQAHFFDLQESMANGGGPACLRLRVPLSREACTLLPAGFFLSEQRADAIEAIINRHYREQLTSHDLQDPHLLAECQAAQQALNTLWLE
jgi:succinylarginine dihydrolase